MSYLAPLPRELNHDDYCGFCSVRDWCLPQRLGPFTSDGSTVVLTFSSDEMYTFQGFRAVFSSVPQAPKYYRRLRPARLGRLSSVVHSAACAAAGSVSQNGSGSVDFSHGFAGNLACRYTFRATPGFVAQVAFVGAFNTARNEDLVRIYNEDSSTTSPSTPLASLSGAIEPGTIFNGCIRKHRRPL